MKKHKSKTLLLFIFLTLLFSTCKKEIKTEVNTSFGSAFNIDRNQEILGVIKSPENGYLIWGNTNIINKGRNDGFVMLIDENYKQIWYKTFGGLNDDYILSCVYDDEENIMAVGSSNSFGVSIDTNSLKRNELIYAVYLNKNGDTKWEKTFQANSGSINNSTSANKVLFLPNKNFAIVGSTTNYQKSFGGFLWYIPNAYIHIIDKNGDFKWYGNYNYYDSIIPLPAREIKYYSKNALTNNEGNIIILMTEESQVHYPFSIIKTSPNSLSGRNKYIWRKPLNNLEFNAFSILENKILKIPFVKSEGNIEKYFLANDTKILYYDDNFNLLNTCDVSDSEINNYILDLKVSNGFLYYLKENKIGKTDLDGNKIWETAILKNINIPFLNGIFTQKDNSISVFGSYINSKNETDILILKLDANGNILIK